MIRHSWDKSPVPWREQLEMFISKCFASAEWSNPLTLENSPFPNSPFASLRSRAVRMLKLARTHILAIEILSKGARNVLS